jgi:hypothetical protein
MTLLRVVKVGHHILHYMPSNSLERQVGRRGLPSARSVTLVLVPVEYSSLGHFRTRVAHFLEKRRRDPATTSEAVELATEEVTSAGLCLESRRHNKLGASLVAPGLHSQLDSQLLTGCTWSRTTAEDVTDNIDYIRDVHCIVAVCVSSRHRAGRRTSREDVCD